MRRGLIILLAGATSLLVAFGALADEPAAGDSAPWHVAKILTADRAQVDAEAPQPDAGPARYLHLRLEFNPALRERPMHKFRVVDARGETVGDLYGHYGDRSILIFEKEENWSSLKGLYLDGLNHREPLFVTEPVAPTVVPTQPVPPARPVVEEPGTVHVTGDAPRVTYVPPAEVRVPRTAVIPNATTQVIETPGTTRIIRSPTHVIRIPDPSRVIVDRTHVVGPWTTHVVHDDTRVIHEGTRVIHHGGTRIVDGSDAAHVVHDGTDVVVGDTQVVHDGVADVVGSGVGVGVAVGAGDGVGVAGGGVGVGGGAGAGSGAGPGAGEGAGTDQLAGVGLGPWDIDPRAQALAHAMQALGSGTGIGTGAGAGAGSGTGSGAGVGAGTGSGTGTGAGAGAGEGAGVGPGTGAAGAGTGSGAGQGPGTGSGPGTGPGQGPGSGAGMGPGEGEGLGPEALGSGPGEGPGPGEGEGPGPEEGPCPDEDEGPGPAEADGPRERGPREIGPREDQGPLPGMAPPPGEGPLPGMAPGPGAGGGGAGGPGARTLGPNYVNMAPQFGPRYVNVAPHLFDAPDFRGPEIYYYAPEIPYYNPEMPVFRPGYPGYGLGYGGGGGGGLGGGGYGGNYPERKMPPLPPMGEIPITPAMVLYISCDDGSGMGRIFQVNEHGGVLGMVNLPFPATGLALHREHGLIAAIPRDGGKLMQIDDTGKVSTILEKDETIVHPVDVALAANSDTVVVADNIADCLGAMTTAGSKPKIYHQFEGQKWDEQQMSVAVTTDKHVIFGTDGGEGIYRFAGDDFSATRGPLLPGRGGVAADTSSLKWAATQSPNKILVFEGEELMNEFQLPANKRLFRHGLLSFGLTGAVIVAARDADKVDDDPWLIQYETEENPNKPEIRNLFKWDRAAMLDFVVGPRMYWERHEPKTYKSIY